MNTRKCELVYGIHTIHSILDNNLKSVICAYVVRAPLKNRLRYLVRRIIECNIHIKECDRSYLDICVKGALHQGIVVKIFCDANNITERNLSNFLTTSTKTLLLLVLDGIIDPHNLGACLRTADAAGVNLVIAPRNHSACINATVRKVASGSVDRVPFLQVTNLSRVLKLLQQYNIWVIGTVVGSERLIFDTKLIGPLAFVMGSEEKGIRYLTKKNCNELISIPIVRSVSALNVAVATGICLFETLRQRRLWCN